MSSAARQARWRAGLKKRIAAGEVAPPVVTEARRDQLRAAQLAYRKSPKGQTAQRAYRHRTLRPFVGVDGEGSGTDELGRQLYMLLRAGEHELFTGSHLTTTECLCFITDLPRGPLYVGFSFGYDITMILRDLPKERLDRLFSHRTRGAGVSPYTWYGLYGIEYLPKNYLRVCRGERYRLADGRDWTRPIPGTARTIYETFSFFQMSFVKSIGAFAIGTQKERDFIAKNKALRGDVAIGDQERAYCAMECDFLARMMERFRETCLAADIRPREWSGAGKISAALLAREGVMRRADVEAAVPARVLELARLAYYGGRFEVTRIGEIAGPIHEYDLHSAYPSAYQTVPCLTHGTWHKASSKALGQLGPDTLWIGPVRFEHPLRPGQRPNVCGLPIRQKTGRICWPAQGRGIYWSTEIDAARALGAVVTPTGPGYRFAAHCDCKPLAWVAGLYQHRKQLQADDTLGGKIAGHPLKLGMNGCYGKLCQRIGAAPYQNMIWAGLITAWCRAQLAYAAATDPAAVVMMATDGIFSTRPLPLELGEELGKWESAVHPRMFVVQPGIYWGTVTRPKTRGADPSFFANKTAIFETAWRDYAQSDRAAHRAGAVVPPVVPLPITLFTGLKLAYSRGKPETAGRWTRSPEDCRHDGPACKCRQFDFDWSGKRGRHDWESDQTAWTYPLPGDPALTTYPHAADRELIVQLDLAKQELEDQPDFVDMGPPRADRA